VGTRDWLGALLVAGSAPQVSSVGRSSPTGAFTEALCGLATACTFTARMRTAIDAQLDLLVRYSGRPVCGVRQLQQAL
jgi:hypothetical protein